MSDKTALITGGANGLGATTARYLAERGWRIFAADLDERALAAIGQEHNITPMQLDVTDAESIERARERVAEACDGLDAVVNFAGILAVGSVVEIDSDVIRRVLDVNVLGTAQVNRAFFPLVLARKGRIINMSSETGWQSAMPFNGAYAMSKHAIEAYSDALRRELMFLGVSVVKIQPGPFRTAMVAGIEERIARAARDSTYFGEMLRLLGPVVLEEQEKANEPAILARVVHRALTARHPRAAYSVKPDFGRSALQLLPTWLADPVIKLALKWALWRHS